jgi:hypothetical protein
VEKVVEHSEKVLRKSKERERLKSLLEELE